MVEPEVAFLDLGRTMELAEEFVTSSRRRACSSRRREELKVLERDIDEARDGRGAVPAHLPTARRSTILQEQGASRAEFGDDFGGDEETVITRGFDRPVIVHRYPSRSRRST